MVRAGLRTKQVADAAGVNVETLRYYERRGILRDPRRARTGYRAYGDEAIQIVRFIKHAQALGFSLDEVEQLLALRRPRPGRCAAVRQSALEKVGEIEEKLRRLTAMRDALAQLAAACVEDSQELECPLIEALLEHDEVRP